MLEKEWAPTTNPSESRDRGPWYGAALQVAKRAEGGERALLREGVEAEDQVARLLFDIA